MSYSMVLTRFPDINYIFFILPVIILFCYFQLSDRSRLRIPLQILFCITSIESILLISEQSIRSGYDSALIILFLFFITSLNDIFQYLCGKLFGKMPLAPRISPNKTIEGAIGGILLTGLVVSLSLPWIVKITWPSAILIGVIIAALGIVGDLNISFIKRQANAKDSGASMPGHGGLLDRIDSLILTAPGFGLCLITLI
jgi:phosphatidate cytidylyltransferase